MKDKLYVINGTMFAVTYLGTGEFQFNNWNGTTWVQDEEKWFNYCQENANVGVNMMRWVGWSVWTKEHNLTPWVQGSDGIYDLSKRNDKYWEIVEQMIKTMNYPSQKVGIKAPGITLWIDLAYQYGPKIETPGCSPWRNNKQGTGSLYDAKAWPFFEAYVMEWIKLKRKGYKIEIGMGNEMQLDGLAFICKTVDVLDREKVFPFSYGICPENPSPDGVDDFKKISLYIVKNKKFLWYNPQGVSDKFIIDCNIMRPAHGCGVINPKTGMDNLEQNLGYWGGKPIRWVGSDDGDMGPEGKPKADKWTEMTTLVCNWQGNTNVLTKPIAVEKPIMGLEHLPDDDPWSEGPGVYQAMADVYKKYLGSALENVGMWPDKYVSPIVECFPGQVKKETCWDGSEIITYECVDGKWAPTNNVCPEQPDQKCSCFYWLNIHDTLFGIPNFLKCIAGKIPPYCKDK